MIYARMLNSTVADSGVEHVCYLLDMVIICVVEAQTQFPLDVVAQLLMELYGAFFSASRLVPSYFRSFW